MMKLSLSTVLALASVACARPNTTVEKRATPTVYLAGDSTMAEGGGGSGTGTQGWGHYLQYSLSIPVVNNAIGGRSARSFTVEGRFDAMASKLKSGDIVIVEFGHNDGGSLSPTDNGRTDCPGAGTETCTSTYNGQTVTVYTYPFYLIQAAKLFVSKGAKVILSSPTPKQPLGSATSVSVGYVDHGTYTANIFKSQGLSTVNTYFPNDHTHTSPAGADVVAKAFVKGLACAGTANSPLASYVKNATSSIPGSCV